MDIKHFNQKQLAVRWGMNEGSLERWRSLGTGPVFLKLQGRVLYRLEDIENHEISSLRQSTSCKKNKKYLQGSAHCSSTK